MSWHRPTTLALVLVLSRAVTAQVTSLDEGSFTVTRGGERIGREDFWIRTAPTATGRTLVAQGTIIRGLRRFKPGLNADTSGAVIRFQNEMRDSGKLVESYAGQLTRDHYAARSQREGGESAREFRLPIGTVAAEDEVVHELWFIVRRGPGTFVPVLVPSRSVVESVRVDLVGDERLVVDIREITARHYTLTTGGTGLVRDEWTDDQGHIVKAAIPSARFLAIRDELR
jgi:hypothetical protein